MLPTTDDVRRSQQMQTQVHLVDVTSRLDEIKQRIQRVQQHQQDQQQELQRQKQQEAKQSQGWDWAKSYQQWSQYEDIDELKHKQHREEEKLDSLIEKQNIMQHAHDHSKEKEFFALPEEVKIRMCEENRQVGNYLFQQDDVVQEELDDLRHACLCNVALSYIRMGWYRQAVEAASQVIKESHNRHAKAFYRRGQAYRYLDEYENSLRDLNKSLQLAPNDTKVLEEKTVVLHLMEGYRQQLTVFSHSVLEKGDYHLSQGTTTTSSTQLQGGDSDTDGKIKDTSNSIRYERKVSLFNEALPVEPIPPRSWQEVNIAIAGAKLN